MAVFAPVPWPSVFVHPPSAATPQGIKCEASVLTRRAGSMACCSQLSHIYKLKPEVVGMSIAKRVAFSTVVVTGWSAEPVSLLLAEQENTDVDVESNNSCQHKGNCL